jgi:hypothetical protein
MGVLYAILGLGQTLFASVVQLGQSVLKCKCTVSRPIDGKLIVCTVGTDLFQGVFGFVAGMSFCLQRAQSADD